MIAATAGGNYSLFITSDGTLWGMGYNASGQLGDGSSTSRPAPVQIATGVVSVSAGSTHSLFLKSDGSLWGMGNNEHGQLGDGTTQNRYTPVQIATGVTSHAAGGMSSLFIKSDGTLWGTGLNTFGGLGGSAHLYTTPRQIDTGVVAMATANNHSLYAKADGSLWTMGYNGHGQLGDGTHTDRRLPMQIYPLNPPVITQSPVSQKTSLIAMEDVVFSVSATGPWLSYKWYRGASGDTAHALLEATSATLVISKPGMSDSYWVRVSNTYGHADSETATLTVKNPQWILFSLPTEHAFVSEPLPLSAHASSTLPVIFAIEGPATLDETGSVLTFTGAGTVSITATQPGDASYDPAQSVTHTITVSKIPQTLTFPTIPTQLFGTAPLALNVSSTSELPVAYEVVSGPATVSGNLLTLTGGGTVTLRASQPGNATYAAAESLVRTFVVNAKPAITTQPVSLKALLGKPATFRVSATGTPAPAYQWRFNGKNISGATKSSYTLAKTSSAHAGDYSVVIKNSSGSVTSANAKLSFGTAPRITSQPSALTVTAGKSATFKVSAAGTATLAYQWRLDGKNISGATQSSYAIPKTYASHAGTYSVVVRNTLGSVTSSGAKLTLNHPAAITRQPASATIAVGKSATLKVTATGSSDLSYQWRFNGKNISGATKSAYSLSKVSSKNAGDYTVVVKNSFGSATSAEAVLTVATPPKITQQPVASSKSAGTAVTFKVAATGGSLSVQWHFKGKALPGATKSSFTINAVSSSHAGDYTVVVKNVAGSVTSSKARLTVIPAPVASPVSIPAAALLHLEGMITDTLHGLETEEVTLAIGAGGVYDYTRTGPATATLSCELTVDDADFSETKTGIITLTFTSAGGGTYSGTGSYQGTHDLDGDYEGTFTRSGTFTYDPSP